MNNISKRQKFGLSILEIILSSFILLILMTLAANIMYASLRVSREERGLAFIRKEAVKGMNWIINDLRRTHGASFLYETDPVTDISMAMSFLGTIGNDAIGTEPTTGIASPKWKFYLIYYLKKDPKNPATVDTSQKYMLKRRAFYPADPYYQKVFNNYVSVVKPIRSTELSYVCGEPASGEPIRIIARNIYDISIIEEEANYITLTIETRDISAKGGEISTVYTSRTLMRNTILQSH